MSLIKLGGVTQSSLNRRTPNFYLASVIHTQSGFIYPRLVTTVNELDSFYGDFENYYMYRDFIENEIPVLLLPVITKSSKYNKCSLRLSDNENFPVSHPGIYKSYDYEDYKELKDDTDSESLLDKLIQKGSDLSEYNFGYLLDFTSVDFSKINNSNYITLFGSGLDQRTDTLFYNVNILIWFTNNGTQSPPVSATDAKVDILIDYTGLSEDEIIQSVKDSINDKTLCYATNIDDYLLHVNGGEDDYLANGILTNYFELPDDPNHEYDPDVDTYVWFSKSDYETNGLDFGSYANYLDYYSGIYIDEITEYISELDTGLISSTILANEVRRILELIFVDTNESFENIFELFTSYWNESEVRLSNNKKILVEYLNDPGRDLGFYDLEGFKYIPLTSYTQDKYSSFTQNDRMIEFYSKSKGESGSNIKIDIKKVPNNSNKNYYEVTITKDSYQEYYLIDTDRKDQFISDELTESNYTSNDQSEYQPLSSLNNSELVSVNIYDYKLLSGMRIMRTQYEDYPEYYIDESGELCQYDYSNDIERYGYGESPVKLIEGSFTLDRYFTEEWTYKNEIDTYKLINDYDYYPDLILCDNLGNYNYSEATEINNSLIELAKDTYSQILVELTKDLIESESVSHKLIINNESRALYFYGDLTLNRFNYCTYYPYIKNILDSNYIKRVTDSILYTNDIDETILDKLNINYLLYNNIYYNYNRLKELDDDTNFIIRFNTSKISRLFMNNQNALVNVEREEFNKTVNSIISMITNILPLVDSINHKVTDNNNLQSIELEVKLTPVTNKTFILNINLNS